MGWGKHKWSFLYANRLRINKLTVEYKYTYNKCKIYTLAEFGCMHDRELFVTA